MGNLSRALLAGGLGFAVSLLAACGGGSGLLSSNQAANLSNHLDEVSTGVAAGNCGAASIASGKLEGAVANLPPTVNSTVQSNLSQAASTVAQLASRQCHQTSTTSTTATTSTRTTSSTTSSSSTSTTTSATATSATTSSSATTTSTGGTTSTGPSGGGGLIPGGGNG